MAISVNAVSGAYFANYGGEYVGITEDGYELEQTTFAEPIRGDNLGDSIQDEVYRGTDVFLNFVLIEYNQAVAASGGTDDTPIFHPHDDVLGQLGKPGVLRGSVSGSGLALTRYSAATTATAVPLPLCAVGEGSGSSAFVLTVIVPSFTSVPPNECIPVANLPSESKLAVMPNFFVPVIISFSDVTTIS